MSAGDISSINKNIIGTATGHLVFGVLTYMDPLARPFPLQEQVAVANLALGATLVAATFLTSSFPRFTVSLVLGFYLIGFIPGPGWNVTIIFFGTVARAVGLIWILRAVRIAFSMNERTA